MVLLAVFQVNSDVLLVVLGTDIKNLSLDTNLIALQCFVDKLCGQTEVKTTTCTFQHLNGFAFSTHPPCSYELQIT